MSGHICVVGSLNIDIAARVERMPAPGETIGGFDMKIHPGGKGGNQAVAAARMGGSVSIIGAVGNDDFGRMRKGWLESEGVDTSLVRVDGSAPTGTALITVDGSGQNSIIVIPGANGAIMPEHIEAARRRIASSALLICQLEIPVDAVSAAIRIAAGSGTPVLLNPAPARPLERDLLSSVDYLVPNEIEAGQMSGIEVTDADSAVAAAEKFHAMGMRNVIITMGSRGAMLSHEGRVRHWNAHNVKAVDTTAAGDSFIGAFAASLMEGRSPEEAVEVAIFASAITVTRHGAQSSLPLRAEVEKAMAEWRGGNAPGPEQ